MKLIFAGTPEFALPSLQALLSSSHKICAVYTQPDRPAGRGRKLLMSPVKKLALENKLSVYQPISLRNAKEQKKLATFHADLMVVVAYGLILPPAILTIPRFGCINVHASLLPRWRGAAPIQRAILEGDRETGVTIMQMDEGLDTGEMIKKFSCTIEPNDTNKTLQDRLADLGARALLESLNDIESGSYRSELQNEKDSTYAKKINKLEAEVDWEKPAVYLDRMVRAFHPKPIARVVLGKSILRICKAEVLDETTSEKPGLILKADREGIDVATGKGVLRLLEVQWPGGKCLPISSFIHGKSELFHVGAILDRMYV
ncbi:MAG: methionyl-tRNA formyltransferase [Candidatus Rickettsiella isopodorum]|nr:methionyl-tRNA formyltransferase [Gammaproteobacteria bacterium]MCH9755131.1 methionyl-tRNA formyltransferase [Gammaproteobacteria bacterium]MDD5161522.1 methionyl-tRNA formyltransferase [Candidatus Rickettsiella isopodorum]MDQ5899577.1 methionyl-tRNA formyltransferase [Pseudomonadota bacterium]